MPTETAVADVLASLPIRGSEALVLRPQSAVFIASDARSQLAAQDYFPAWLCLSGALTSDWSILKGRSVYIWPTAGFAGRAQADKLAELIMPHCSALTLYDQDDMPAGWTLAHAKDEGKSEEWIAEHAGRDEGAHILKLKGKKQDRPKAPGAAVAHGVQLQLDKRGDPYCNVANCYQIFSKHERFAGKFWYDDFEQRLIFGDKHFDEEVEGLNAQAWFQQHLLFYMLSSNAIMRGALRAGLDRRRNPLREHLEAFKWDGTERLPGMMANVYGAERNAYTEAVGQCWMIAAIARVFSPGCKSDCMLVLEGVQGALKSTSLQILGGAWFGESHDHPLDARKDFLSYLQGKWIVEIPEMHSIAGAVNGIEKIKGLLSCQVDDYRKAYGRQNIKHPRQCIFAGTTNRDQWNSDPTGGRRFWPIQCGSIDIDYLSANRDQLWAEALVKFRSGEKWWLIPTSDAFEEQDKRRLADVWEPTIERFVTHIPLYDRDGKATWEPRSAPLEHIHIDTLLTEGLNVPIGKVTRSEQMRAAGTLIAMGWHRERLSTKGVREYAYRRNTLAQRPISELQPLALPAPSPPPTTPVAMVEDDDIPF